MADNYGFNIDLGLNTAELRKGLKDVNRELSAEKSDLSAINTQLKYDANNVDLWKKKQQALNKQVDTTKKKLELLKKQLLAAQKSKDPAATKEIERLQNQIQRTTNDIKKMEAELKNAGSKISNLSMVDGRRLTALGSTLTNSITKPALAAATAVAGLSYKMTDTVNNIGDMSKQVGANAQSYQELSYAAKILGADSDSLYKAFRTVNDMMGDIATGNSLEVAQNLYKIGLSIEDITGLDSTEAFMKIRDALAEVEDESLRVALANEIFGDKIGAQLLPLLTAEKDEIDALREKANDLGIATDDQIEKADEFQDSVTDLKQALFGVSLQLMETLLPTMQKVVDFMQNNVAPALKDIMKKWDGLSEGQKTAILSAGGLVVALGPMLTIFGHLVTSLGSIKTALAAGGTALKAFGVAGGPVTIAIAAVAAALVYAWTTSDEFRESIMSLLSKIKELAAPIKELATTLLQSLKPVLDKVIELSTFLYKTILEPIINFIVNRMIKEIQNLTNFIKKVSDVITPIITFLLDTTQKGIQKLTEVLKPFTDALKKAFDFVKDIIDTIKNFLSSKIGQAFDWVGDKLSDLFRGAMDKVSGVFGGNTTNNTTNNSVSVYTSRAEFDIASINDALGGRYM